MTDYGTLLVWFRAGLLTYAGIIFLLEMGSKVVLWSMGSPTPGAVVAAGSVSIRLMIMSG